MRIGIGFRAGPFWVGKTLWRSGRRPARTYGVCGTAHRSALKAASCSRCASQKSASYSETRATFRAVNAEAKALRAQRKLQRAVQKAEQAVQKAESKPGDQKALHKAQKAMNAAATLGGVEAPNLVEMVNSPQTSPVAGWYQDAQNCTRWWNGRQWTSATTTKAGPGPRDWVPIS